MKCKQGATSLSTTEKLSLVKGGKLDIEDATRYRNIVGALQYLTLTWPNISYSVNMVCVFIHGPNTIHWTTTKIIMRYLSGTIMMGLSFTRSPSALVSSFSDADWQVV